MNESSGIRRFETFAFPLVGCLDGVIPMPFAQS